MLEDGLLPVLFFGFLLGVKVLAFKLTIPNTIALPLEFIVGIALVILGISIPIRNSMPDQRRLL